MEFYDVVKKRRSVRAFKNDPICEKSLARIAQSLQDAPSACNIQPWKFQIVFNQELRNKIYSCYTRPWLKEAPAIIVALADMDKCWKRLDGRPIADMDIGIAMEHVVLAAAAENLGTCWICAYNVEEMDRSLEIRQPWTVLAISPLGYAASAPAPINRKPITEIFEVIN
ncbi:MAG: hypothetical protein A2020_04685 [Lentisphaerae bacterium GWF2_45_14]|nr:MAG: hypothetical protein A2020_04685 [Lentisphaerae bacterium GWF2_45_14]